MLRCHQAKKRRWVSSIVSKEEKEGRKEERGVGGREGGREGEREREKSWNEVREFTSDLPFRPSNDSTT